MGGCGHNTIIIFSTIMSRNLVYVDDELGGVEEDFNDVETCLQMLKRSRDRWNETVNDVEAILIEDQMVGRNTERIFRTRKVYPRENYKQSCWYLFLQRDFSDLNSRDSKFFRNRFTVPYQLYQQLLQLAKEWFPQKKYDIAGREWTPIFLKLLGTLRILGKGCSWDLLYELSGISGEVHRKWTLQFLHKFGEEMYPIHVHGPRDTDELNKVTSLYAAVGFPGCVGSTDCVHIRWEMCPSLWFSSYKNGKNSYASIAYEMTVDHTKRFQSTTVGHYGTTSDMTIVKFDGFVNKVKYDPLFTETEFKYLQADNKWALEKGLYLLVDGGYHKWRIMQCPFKFSLDDQATRWSEQAESVRKDVECSFGILKKRFQFLKNSITWHRKSDIDNAVFSCVILHNMLHEFDGYDIRWEDELNNCHNDEEEQICLDRIRRRVVRTLENNTDHSNCGYLHYNMNNINYANYLNDEVEMEITNEHTLLQKKLIKHFDVKWLNNEIRWITI